MGNGIQRQKKPDINLTLKSLTKHISKMPESYNEAIVGYIKKDFIDKRLNIQTLQCFKNEQGFDEKKFKKCFEEKFNLIKKNNIAIFDDIKDHGDEWTEMSKLLNYNRYLVFGDLLDLYNSEEVQTEKDNDAKKAKFNQYMEKIFKDINEKLNQQQINKMNIVANNKMNIATNNKMNIVASIDIELVKALKDAFGAKIKHYDAYEDDYGSRELNEEEYKKVCENKEIGIKYIKNIFELKNLFSQDFSTDNLSINCEYLNDNYKHFLKKHNEDNYPDIARCLIDISVVKKINKIHKLMKNFITAQQDYETEFQKFGQELRAIKKNFSNMKTAYVEKVEALMKNELYKNIIDAYGKQCNFFYKKVIEDNKEALDLYHKFKEEKSIYNQEKENKNKEKEIKDILGKQTNKNKETLIKITKIINKVSDNMITNKEEYVKLTKENFLEKNIYEKELEQLKIENENLLKNNNDFSLKMDLDTINETINKIKKIKTRSKEIEQQLKKDQEIKQKQLEEKEKTEKLKKTIKDKFKPNTWLLSQTNNFKSTKKDTKNTTTKSVGLTKIISNANVIINNIMKISAVSNPVDFKKAVEKNTQLFGNIDENLNIEDGYYYKNNEQLLQQFETLQKEELTVEDEALLKNETQEKNILSAIEKIVGIKKDDLIEQNKKIKSIQEKYKEIIKKEKEKEMKKATEKAIEKQKEKEAEEIMQKYKINRNFELEKTIEQEKNKINDLKYKLKQDSNSYQELINKMKKINKKLDDYLEYYEKLNKLSPEEKKKVNLSNEEIKKIKNNLEFLKNFETDFYRILGEFNGKFTEAHSSFSVIVLKNKEDIKKLPKDKQKMIEEKECLVFYSKENESKREYKKEKYDHVLNISKNYIDAFTKAYNERITKPKNTPISVALNIENYKDYIDINLLRAIAEKDINFSMLILKNYAQQPITSARLNDFENHTIETNEYNQIEYKHHTQKTQKDLVKYIIDKNINKNIHQIAIGINNTKEENLITNGFVFKIDKDGTIYARDNKGNKIKNKHLEKTFINTYFNRDSEYDKDFIENTRKISEDFFKQIIEQGNIIDDTPVEFKDNDFNNIKNDEEEENYIIEDPRYYGMAYLIDAGLYVKDTYHKRNDIFRDFDPEYNTEKDLTKCGTKSTTAFINTNDDPFKQHFYINFIKSERYKELKEDFISLFAEKESNISEEDFINFYKKFTTDYILEIDTDGFIIKSLSDPKSLYKEYKYLIKNYQDKSKITEKTIEKILNIVFTDKIKYFAQRTDKLSTGQTEQEEQISILSNLVLQKDKYLCYGIKQKELKAKAQKKKDFAKKLINLTNTDLTQNDKEEIMEALNREDGLELLTSNHVKAKLMNIIGEDHRRLAPDFYVKKKYYWIHRIEQLEELFTTLTGENIELCNYEYRKFFDAFESRSKLYSHERMAQIDRCIDSLKKIDKDKLIDNISRLQPEFTEQYIEEKIKTIKEYIENYGADDYDVPSLNKWEQRQKNLKQCIEYNQNQYQRSTSREIINSVIKNNLEKTIEEEEPVCGCCGYYL